MGLEDDNRHPDAGLSRREVLRASGEAAAAARVLTAAGIGGVAAAFLAVRADAQQQGQSRLYEAINRKTLVVGTGNGNPPWHFQNEKGEMAGFDIAMGRLIAKGLFNDPTRAQFQIQSSAARIPSLLTDKVDIVFQFMTINSLRAQQVEFSTPYYREGVGLLLAKNSPYRDYRALLGAGARIKCSVLQNVGADDLVHQALPKAQPVQLDSQANVIQAVDSGRVDVAAVDQSTVRWLTIQHPDKYHDSGKGYYPQLYGAALKPGDEIWRTFVNTVLEVAMGGNEWPTYKAEYKTYFGIELPDPPIGFPIEARMDQAMGLMRRT
ncbi:MAG TPA: transporter substrate-binding domain-containing protein [bacterium]|nr:transporter substrate-binding domain-containing protein [bacterium]